MTVETTARKQSFAGGQTNLTFSFRASADHPEEIKVNAVTGGTETLLTYLTHYTVAVESDGVGGVVTLAPTFSTAYTHTVYRQRAKTQTSDYEDYNAFPAETLESDLDKRTMIEQEILEDVGRSLKVPISSTADTELPAPVSNKIFGWNTAADAIENKSQVVTSMGDTNMLFLSNYATFAAAIAAIGATDTTLVIDTDADVDVDTTVPATTYLWVVKKGVFNIDSGKTLTINGPFDAGFYRVFTGDGDVSFATGSVKCVYVEWFLDNTTPGTTDMAPAFVDAIASLPVRSASPAISDGVVQLLSSTYRINSQVVFPMGVSLIGVPITSGPANATSRVHGSRIIPNFDGANIKFLGTAIQGCGNVLQWVQFTGGDAAKSTAYAVQLYDVLDFKILNCDFSHLAMNAIEATGATSSNMVRITNCTFKLIGDYTTWTYGNGINFTGCSDSMILDCWVESCGANAISLNGSTKVKGCWISASKTGMVVNANGNTIIGNTILANQQNGIYFDAASKENILSNNHIGGNNLTGGTYYDVWYKVGSKEIVSNNIIVGTGSTNSINIQAAGGTIEGNNIENGIKDQNALYGSTWFASNNFIEGKWVGKGVKSVLLLNGSFTTSTTSWTAVASTLASTTGGTINNCLQITRSGGTINIAQQTLALIVGRIYRVSAWVKSGSSGADPFGIYATNSIFNIVYASVTGSTTSTWTPYMVDFIPRGVSCGIQLRKSSSSAGTMLFDEIKVEDISE